MPNDLMWDEGYNQGRLDTEKSFGILLLILLQHLDQDEIQITPAEVMFMDLGSWRLDSGVDPTTGNYSIKRKAVGSDRQSERTKR